MPLDYAIGADRTSLDDGREWTWSCSFYPGELRNEARVELFRTLIGESYSNVDFSYGNFIEPKGLEILKQKLAERGRSKVEIAFCSTMAYQLSEDERETLYANAAEIAEEFVVIQDFCRVDPRDRTHLIFRDDWQDDQRPYRFMVRDLRSDNPKAWHEIFLWSDGRCNELTIATGRIALGDAALRRSGVRGQTGSIWGALDRRAKAYR